MGSHSKDKLDWDMQEARISVLEKQVEFLLKLNGLNLSEFKTADSATLLQVYRDAVQLLGLSHKRIDLEIIEKWSNTFLQLSEIEIVRLQPIVEIVHTWEPFYLLCLRMLSNVRTHPMIHTSLRTQQLYSILEKGLRGLRAIGAIMLKKNPKDLSLKAKLLLSPDDLEAYLPK